MQQSQNLALSNNGKMRLKGQITESQEQALGYKGSSIQTYYVDLQKMKNLCVN